MGCAGLCGQAGRALRANLHEDICICVRDRADLPHVHAFEMLAPHEHAP